MPNRIKEGALTPESTPSSPPEKSSLQPLITGYPRKWILGNENGEIYAVGYLIGKDEEIEVAELKTWKRHSAKSNASEKE